MAVEILQFTHSWSEHVEFGRVTAATRETSTVCGSPMAESFEYFRRIKKQNLKHVRTAHRHLQWWNWRLAGAENFELIKDCGELPDSASSEPYASIGESDSDDFDDGALMDQSVQRDQLFQTSSLVSTQSWSQSPNQSWQNRWWEHSQNSWDQTDYHSSLVAGFPSFFSP